MTRRPDERTTGALARPARLAAGAGWLSLLAMLALSGPGVSATRAAPPGPVAGPGAETVPAAPASPPPEVPREAAEVLPEGR